MFGFDSNADKLFINFCSYRAHGDGTGYLAVAYKIKLWDLIIKPGICHSVWSMPDGSKNSFYLLLSYGL